MHLKKIFFFLIYLSITFGYGQNSLQKIKAEDSLRVDYNTTIDKRNYEANFKEKYTSDRYNYESETNPNGWFSRLKKWFTDLINDLFKLNDDIEAEQLVTIISRVIYLLIFLFVIYIIVKAILNKEGNWIFGRYSDKKALNIHDVEANLHTTDFEKLIAQANNDKNYRLAVRYYYLWLLKELSDGEHIHYDAEKTNSDYINEIDDKTLKSKFSYSSYLYNYIWYGEFPIEEAAYKNAAIRFETLIKSVKK